jgi:hypothetical protein
MILSNVIRASYAEPLSFVQMGKVSGTTTQSGTMGLPAIMFGPHIPNTGTFLAQHAEQSETSFGANPAGASGAIGNSTTLSGSTNFEVTPTETKEFYRALLSEVDPRTLELFAREGISRELLLYLFTDRVVVSRGGNSLDIANEPLDPTYKADQVGFAYYVDLAVKFGLTSEPVPGQPKAKPAGKAKDGSATAAEPQRWHLCFSPSLRDKRLPPATNSPACGEAGKPEDDQTVRFVGGHGEQVTVKILPRSIFSIFQFLGHIVAAGQQGQIKLKSAEAIGLPPLSDDNLFVVTSGENTQCFAMTTHDGQTYCVPLNGATNTKRILGILTQLIALNTTVNDVPVTPTVRVLR